MEALRIRKTLDRDGEITIEDLPYKKGQEVEMILLLEPSDEPKPLPTVPDLLESELVGMWKNRTDIEDSAAFARKLREDALRGSRLPCKLDLAWTEVSFIWSLLLAIPSLGFFTGLMLEAILLAESGRVGFRFYATSTVLCILLVLLLVVAFALRRGRNWARLSVIAIALAAITVIIITTAIEPSAIISDNLGTTISMISLAVLLLALPICALLFLMNSQVVEEFITANN